ncbi:FHA domain-containing protein [Microbacterium sp. NPDC089695]|uniref:FHA domain-containing protein n=1 Tax=Microbacterium sp. NPDC089695 TaxID=3364198 RepID=UPI00381620FB
MSTQCRFCGEAVRPDSMFCPSCGQLIGMPGNVVPPFPGSAGAAAPATPAEQQRAAEPLPPVPLPAPLAAEQPSAPAPATPQPAAPASSPATPEPTAATPEPQPAASAPVIPTAVSLPDGQRLGLDTVLVFGRSPERGAASYQGTPVRLDDPARAMSRVHLVLSPAAGAVIATDPGSANGTLLERDGTQYALVAGTPSALVPGDRLLLGDAVLLVS